MHNMRRLGRGLAKKIPPSGGITVGVLRQVVSGTIWRYRRSCRHQFGEAGLIGSMSVHPVSQGSEYTTIGSQLVHGGQWSFDVRSNAGSHGLMLAAPVIVLEPLQSKDLRHPPGNSPPVLEPVVDRAFAASQHPTDVFHRHGLHVVTKFLHVSIPQVWILHRGTPIIFIVGIVICQTKIMGGQRPPIGKFIYTHLCNISA